MICQECNQRPATLHFTKIMNGEKTEFHLCEKCAQEHGDMFMLNNGSGFSINNLLSGLFNIDTSYANNQAQLNKQAQVVQCEQCSMTFPQFVKVGKFGCAHCYESFRAQLKPIIKRLHSGNWNHNGKIPTRMGGDIHLKKQIEDLKINLKELITKEEFEKAAETRDAIRQLEKEMKNHLEGGE
ncbi:hypothetical protein MKX83_00545 [Cytobacillus sp. FSL M8-0252]|uniref:hypothetical protein n=1 Tax=Cytobacillus sp. FSL M8-0252 TaxID=2921621 RepID=UPI0030F51B95